MKDVHMRPIHVYDKELKHYFKGTLFLRDLHKSYVVYGADGMDDIKKNIPKPLEQILRTNSNIKVIEV